jgi:hypothetical protein
VTGFDLTDTIAPNSDQLDSVDFLQGPRTFTIERVSKGDAEQPVQIHLVDFPRPWRPGKSMRRVLVACWGADASTYAGRRVQLFCDPKVVFGGQAVGGTRIAALSHIDKAKQVPLLVARGKSAIFTVQPLPDASTPARAKQTTAREPTVEELISDAEVATTNDELNRIARAAAATLTKGELDAVREVVTARRADLQTGSDS